ncbi:MAG: MerR family transcriptional regulator [Myxococcales bacterium]|nr:MerR family transcriptional regulator [Myxococcales bacterium]
MDSGRLLKVGELAKAAGKTVRAIHLYEELELLAPASRSEGGFRLYGPDAIARVAWIGKLQDAGLTLPEIQAMLREWGRAPSAARGMELVRARFEEHLRETRETIARLTALERELVASLAYLESCVTCEPVRLQTECAVCNHHGHDPAARPALVAGLARPEFRYDVALSDISEGHR